MTEFELPITRYALSGDVNIAYQVMGNAPRDIVLVPGSISHVEFLHEIPGYTSFLQRLSNFARVITFDKRGQGLSDRISGTQSLEQRMDDVRAVLDQVGSTHAVLLGFSEGAAMSAAFAATYPERVSHVIFFGGFARYADLSGSTQTPEERIDRRVQNWGQGEFIKGLAPSQAANSDATARFGKLERLSSTPGAYKAFLLLNLLIDIRPILPSVRVPALVLHRRTDAIAPIELGRDLASRIPGAKFIEYPEGDHAFWVGDVDAVLDDIEEFITGSKKSSPDDAERVLATVLFTDIVDSTRRATELGDRTWRKLLDSHDHFAKEIIDRHRGLLIKATGDGILATFDGPGRAVRCALAFEGVSKQLGLATRAGLHTGEIELRGKDIGGVAVHAAARVMSQCAPNEVLVSRVVTDLVAGAGLKFVDRGSYELKGLPGKWDLFAASL